MSTMLVTLVRTTDLECGRCGGLFAPATRTLAQCQTCGHAVNLPDLDLDAGEKLTWSDGGVLAIRTVS